MCWFSTITRINHTLQLSFSVIGADLQNRPNFGVSMQIKHLQIKLKNTRRILIYKGNLLLNWHFGSKTRHFMGCQKTAPKISEIPLARQGLIKVQLYCPDFDNGMKTNDGFSTIDKPLLYCPDFDNGMKTVLKSTAADAAAVVLPGL